MLNPFIGRAGLWSAAVLFLGACASGPKYDTARVDPGLTPQRAAASADTARGERVLWGGVIISSTNLRTRSQIEVLAYPLTDNQKPDLSAKPQGRFLIVRPGYLETLDYTQGKSVTAIGSFDATQRGKIGESDYTYPVLAAEQIHLWPPESERSSEPQIHFGIGVIFGN